jgi:predicted transcriptional regulator
MIELYPKYLIKKKYSSTSIKQNISKLYKKNAIEYNLHKKEFLNSLFYNKDYDKIVKFKKLLGDFNNSKMQSLEVKKEYDFDVLEEIKKLDSQNFNYWDKIINKIETVDKISQRNKINQLFDSWDELDDEQEQKETLKIMQSSEGISI